MEGRIRFPVRGYSPIVGIPSVVEIPILSSAFASVLVRIDPSIDEESRSCPETHSRGTDAV